MKDRFYMGKVGDGQFVINPNDLEASPVSLDGRVVGQTPENGSTRKCGYSFVNGKLTWLDREQLALPISAQISTAREKKAAFQGIKYCPNLRV